MFMKMILSKIHFCCKIWMAKNCNNHRFRPVFVTFLHFKFIMAHITALGHISNFIFCSLDMCPNSISYTKNYQNLSHGLCHPLPGFSMDSLLTFYFGRVSEFDRELNKLFQGWSFLNIIIIIFFWSLLEHIKCYGILEYQVTYNLCVYNLLTNVCDFLNCAHNLFNRTHIL